MTKSQRYLALIVWTCSSLLEASHPLGLTIDNQLAIVANDCYTRISIGTKLPASSSSLLATHVATVSDCEEECSKKRNSCDVFSFGIDLKGNATCALGANVPKFEDLQPDPDYDVYVRSQRTPHCEPDRIYKFESGLKSQRKNLSASSKVFPTAPLRPVLPNIRQPARSGNDGISLAVYPTKYPSYFLSADDDESRVSDILANKNQRPIDGYTFSYRKPIVVEENPNPLPRENDRLKSDFFEAEQKNVRESFARDAAFQFDRSRYFLRDYEHRNHREPTASDKDRGWVPLNLKQNKLISHEHAQHSPVLDDVHGIFRFINDLHRNLEEDKRLEENFTYNFPDFHGFSMNSFDNYDNGGYRFGDRIHQKVKACYRRLLSGKKIHETHVRRAIECQTIDDCHRACDYEKLFDCTGFNYRRVGDGPRGVCELTSTPYPRMDVHRDFATDPRCDFYEKDLNCQSRTHGSGNRPSWSYDYPARPVSRPRDADQRFSNQLPRPLDYYPDRPIARDRPPIYGSSYQPNNPYYQRPYPTDRTYSEDPYSSRGPDNRHYYDAHQTSYKRPYPAPPYTDRRMDYDPYHRDIGTNEVGHNGYWPTYGGVYGSSYPHDTNTIGSYDTKNLSRQPAGRPAQHHPPPPPPRPYENDHFYGEFYHYGGAFGYGDNYPPSYKDLIYGGSGGGDGDDCSIRAGAGFKLGRAIVRKSFLTPNLDQCESLCVTEKTFLCMTFAYRYNVAATDPTDNCLLSDVSYRDLNFYTDLVPDHDYDIYAVIGDVKTCGGKKSSDQRPPDECFWRVRSGFGMPADVTRKATTVQGIGDCQVECTLSHDFTCRSFAFTYSQRGERRNNGSRNCYLSDWPSQEINPANMPDLDGAELYERGSFGRGCEPYPLPSLQAGRFADNKPFHENKGCYSGYHKPCKLTPYAVILATRADSESDCREKCTRMRIVDDTTPCMSFSFRVRGSGIDENCLLSDVPIRDLRPGLDYMYDDEHVLYAWRDLDPRCHVSASPADDEHVHGVASYGSGRPLPPGPSYATDVGYSYGPASRPNANAYGYGPIGDTYGAPAAGYDAPAAAGGVRPLDPDRPDPIGSPHYNFGAPGSDATRPFYPPEGQTPYDDVYAQGARPFDPHRPDTYRPVVGQHAYGGFTGDHFPPHRPAFPHPMDDFYTFRHYTVNGYPCKRGSRCEKNKLAGFWSCETEGAAFSSWDYCCAPNSRCGYSRGFHYPWCYVGPSEDQWRPCSEKYYPYLPSPRPLRPKQHRYGDDDDRPFYVDSSLPDYSARHWPVIYVHGEPPPNCTTDSIAAAAAQLPATRRINDTSYYATTRYASNVNADRSDGKQTRRRRLRARTIKSRDSVALENERSGKSSNNLRKDAAEVKGVQFNNTEVVLPETRRNQTFVLPARKIGAQVTTAGLRAGKIERIEKPSNGRESSFPRATNATGLPIV